MFGGLYKEMEQRLNKGWCLKLVGFYQTMTQQQHGGHIYMAAYFCKFDSHAVPILGKMSGKARGLHGECLTTSDDVLLKAPS